MLFMMNRQFNLTRWILLILASFLPLATMAQETADDENKVEEELLPQPKGKPNYVLTMGIIPKDYPLAIKEKNASAIGTLQEYEHKPVLLTLKNISDKTIKITHVESTCPCLELAAMSNRHARASNSPRPYRTRRSRRRRSCPSISPSTPRISDTGPLTAS